MNNKKEITTVLTREEMFKARCKVFDLRREYPKYDGKIYWAIATSYSKVELDALYSDFISPYEPYMILSEEEGSAMSDYIRNEKKHLMRRYSSEDIYGFQDGDMESFHSEIAVPDFQEELIQRQEVAQLLSHLSDIHRKRIYEFYFIGKTKTQIALEEGVSVAAVTLSIQRSLQKLKKYFETC